MAKKPSVTKELETAQKKASQTLERTRVNIRKLGQITPYQYCLLYEDSVHEAKAGAERIESFFKSIEVMEKPVLLLLPDETPLDKHIKSSGREKRLVIAVIGCPSIEFSPHDHWSVVTDTHFRWDDGSILPLQSTHVMKERAYHRFSTPLHRLLAGSERLPLAGEEAVADRLCKVEPREGGPRDRFNFFYDLTRKLGYELKDKKLRKRIEEERERVIHDCEYHLKSLEGMLEEFFVKGARDQMVGSKSSDGSANLVSRAHALCQSVRLTLNECKLYDVETEHSLEIQTFAKRWMRWNGIFLGD